MNLSLLKYLTGRSFSGMNKNPYYFRLRIESLSEKIIGKFLEWTHPFFHGDTPEQAWADRLEEDMDNGDDLGGSYEWVLNQSSSTLLVKDFSGILRFWIPSPALYLFRKWISYLEISYSLDDWDENFPVMTAKETGSNEGHVMPYPAERAGPGPGYYFRGFRMICYRLAIRLMKRPKGHLSAFLRMDMVSASFLKESSGARKSVNSMYPIRGPSFVKNILLLFSNKRN